MKKNQVIIVGAGGHAKVILSTLLELEYDILGLLDDQSSLWQSKIFGFTVLGSCDLLKDFDRVHAVCAFGNNQLRQSITQKFNFVNWLSLIHPKAYVHQSVCLGPGTVVFAGAVIQPDASIGSHVIINTSVSVDHDCLIEDYAHLAPGSHLGGGVSVGKGTLLGIGSHVKPYTTIGEWTIVGVGSAVVKDIPSTVTAKGVPAKIYG